MFLHVLSDLFIIVILLLMAIVCVFILYFPCWLFVSLVTVWLPVLKYRFVISVRFSWYLMCVQCLEEPFPGRTGSPLLMGTKCVFWSRWPRVSSH